MPTTYQSTFEYKLIYIFRINDDLHKGLVKIGDATVHTDLPIERLMPNCRELNQAAKARINSYTTTAGFEYELLYTELAIYTCEKNGVTTLQAFRDKKVHRVLMHSGIRNHLFQTENKGVEWFECDLATAIKAIAAVKAGRASLNSGDISKDDSPIIFRPEQKKAIEDTLTQFKRGDRMLWNAKMRFGKTLTALEVAKRGGFKKTLIFTHRPVVSEGWFEDFNKIFKGTDYKFGSKTKGEPIENLVDNPSPFVYFASIQDLRGSQAVGGKFDKNDFIFLIEWDFIIVDEAHEGTQTTLGQKVLEAVLSNSPDKKPKLLELSGTPFNLLSSFKNGEIYTWDYIMEQRAKADWDKYHFGDSNPYDELPRLEIYTYELNELISGYVDEDSAFNFREFFRVWTGDIKRDFKPVPDGAHIGDFVHKDDVTAFLNLLCIKSDETNFPFSTEEYRSYYRHTLWILPGVKEAKALSALMHAHPVFGSGAFKIANVAGDGDEEENYKDALQKVRSAIGTDPDDHYSITLSCGRLTTGVTVPEWTAVFMLAGSFSTSASNYLQTIFRVQSPANINGRIKERCSVFDFAPDRTLKMVAEAGRLSSKVGSTSTDRVIMGEFLNFCPVISIKGSEMSAYNVDGMLQQLKKAYTDRVIKSGFEDKALYNDNLLKLDDIDIKAFEELKDIIGATKQTKATREITVNDQGYTDEQYEEIERIEKKPKKERTPEEQAFLDERKKKRESAQKAIDILRGISIRIPLLIYGADVPFDKEITVDNFTDIVDDASWEEFMPAGVTKPKYKQFKKYYEQDVFIAAGRQIRDSAKAADALAPTERVKRIAEIFSMFKNPDKETVLTPWRVVNMHLSDCLGGYNFYDEDFENPIDEPQFVDRGEVTQKVFCNPDAKILEINSKTGLYPLYVVYSIFRYKIGRIPVNELTDTTVWSLWKQTVEDNLFVVCKTPMAKAITRRTLLGYREGKINAHAFDNLINQLKNKPEQFIEKVLRGSTWNREETKMKFEAIVGNPPYQVMDGGNAASAMPVYNLFVDVAKHSAPKYVSMIMPARWYAGGKGLDKFRENMLSDVHIMFLGDFANSQDCFSNVNIAGGICYFLWGKDYCGDCQVRNYGLNTMSKAVYRSLGEYPIFVRNNISSKIIDKIHEKRLTNLDQFVKSYSYFAIRSYERGSQAKNAQGDIILISSEGKGFYPRSKVTDRDNILKKYKVIITYAMSGGNKPSADGNYQVISSLQILGKNEVCTETYLVLGAFDAEEQAQNMKKYIATRFVRFLLLQALTSIHITRDSFIFVPLQDFTENSDIDWSLSIPDIDKQLYAKYHLTEEEISFIESMIKPME